MRVVQQSEMARRWDQWKAERVRKSRVRHEKRIRGLGLVVRLEDGRTLAFRGRKYEVPPVPWRVAVEVLETEEAMADLQKDKSPNWAEWLALYRRVGRLFKRAVRPASGWRRWLWPALPSPMRNATPSEVGEALRFFSLCLMMDHGEAAMSSLAPRGTSQETSPDSSDAFRNGARAASRKAGSTS